MLLLLLLLAAAVEVKATGEIVLVEGEGVLFLSLLIFCEGLIFPTGMATRGFGFELLFGVSEGELVFCVIGALGGGEVIFRCFSMCSNLESIESSVTFHWSILLIRWLSFCSMVLMKVVSYLAEVVDRLIVLVFVVFVGLLIL